MVAAREHGDKARLDGTPEAGGDTADIGAHPNAARRGRTFLAQKMRCPLARFSATCKPPAPPLARGWTGSPWRRSLWLTRRPSRRASWRAWVIWWVVTRT